MAKILYITSFLPYDTPFAGSKTSYRILKNISKNNKIELFSFCTEVEVKYIENFKKFCNENMNISLIDIVKVNKITRVLNSLLFFFMPAFLVARFSIFHLFKLKNRYDFIYLDWSQSVFFGYVLSKILGIKVIYSIADVITQSLERKYKQEKNLIKKIIFGFEYLKTSFIEKRLLSSGKLIIIQSEKDKDILINMGIDKEKIVSIAPYFNQDMFFEDKCNEEKTFNILFWGAMNRIENMDAVDYYFSTYHALLKERIPQYRFIIAGANPPKSLVEKYEKNNTVYITGFIDDPSDIFNISHMSVVPLRLGAGIKVKTLESLYMGLPTIATDVGAEGIYIDEQDGLYIENNEELYLKKIIDIYNNYNSINKSNIHNNIKDLFDFDKSLESIDLNLKNIEGVK
jgi:glycosyltransferase involved in cell wall biosynthesis